jgi:DNA polymerase III alpha subunit
MEAVVLEGQLRHMGKHAAGVIVGDKPLEQIIALYEKNDFKISSVEMKDALSLGLLKIDVLGIKELTIIRKAAELVGMSLEDVYRIPLDDEETLRGFNELDVDGIFQFDGDSTKSVLRQIPDVNSFRYLVDCVALSKPGPAHSGGTTNYLSRERGDSSVKAFDWHPILKRITDSTNGQIIYQEQVIQIVRQVAGMPATDANTIRNLIAKSKGEIAFENLWPAFLEGAQKNGVTEKQANEIWVGIKTFGRWAFNKSHSVSYAVLSFWSMYMKRHHTQEFYLARLMKEEKEDKLRRLYLDIANKGIELLPPMLGKSQASWTLEGGNIRAGLLVVKGIGPKVAEKLIENDYKSRDDFTDKKTKGITKRALTVLGDANALPDMVPLEDYFGIHEYDVLDELAPARTRLSTIKDESKGHGIVIAGIFREMNYKDIHEERRSRSLPAVKKDPEISKYAMMLLEDETDRCLVNIDRYVFQEISDKVWDAYNNASYVVIKGYKVNGWRIVRANEIKVIEKAQEK